MANYSFKKEASVYVVFLGNRYSIDISEITFNQTIQEESYSELTLQEQKYFEQSTIVKANPANFSLIFPAIREADLKILFDRALDNFTFDLYIETYQDVFKIEKCVVTNAGFLVRKDSVLAVEITGQGSKLSREGDYGVFTVPGTVVERSGSRTYNISRYVVATLNSIVYDSFVLFSVELQNEVKWTSFTTVPEACLIGTISYPQEFSISKKILSGTFSVNTIDDITFNSDTTLLLEVGEKVSGTLYGFTFNLSNVAFTSRYTTNAIFNHNYDWRLTQNPDSLYEIITYNTSMVGESGALLDHLGADLLDHLGQALLESP